MKKIITVTVLILAIMLCGACGSPQNNDELKTQTDAHEQQIAALEQQAAALEKLITSQSEPINSLTEQIEKLSEIIDDESLKRMQGQLSEQQKKIDLYKAQLRNLTGKPIQFTEEAPIYGGKEGDETIVEYNSFDDNPYLCFMNYYEKNKPNEDDFIYYIFRPDDYEDELKVLIAAKYTNRHYSLVKQDENFLIKESLIIYDEVFDDGMWDEELEDYAPSWQESFHLTFYLDPVKKYSEEIFDYNYFRLEFGQTDSGSTYFNMYINTYCIGTCYYGSNCYVSYTGLKDYLYNRLVAI